METGHIELIKRLNRSSILNLIRTSKTISRAKIAQQLNLSRSTVSSIVDELIAKRLVVEIGYGASTSLGGRRGIELGFNPDSAYGIGVDIGGTKIFVVITNWDGKIIFKQKMNTTNDIGKIIEIIHDCIALSNIDKTKIVAMGLGLPGATNVKEGIVLDAPALKWANMNLVERLKPHFNFPIHINNDVNCAAMGERWLGSGGQSHDLFFIAIGTGVGSALISNGYLIAGHQHMAGEIAYTIGEDDVNKNNFNELGEFGTFEKKVSGLALSQHGYTAKELFLEYERNNPVAKAVIDDFVKKVSIVIANAVSLLNPEKVVIGGGVSESMHVVLKDIQEAVSRYTIIRTDIALAVLGGDAGGLGAIAYAFKEVEESNLL